MSTTTPPSHSDQTPRPRAARICFLQTLALLALGMVPVPVDWSRARSALDSARFSGMNRADREGTAAGYYEGLIGHGDGPLGPRAAIGLRILGKPADWGRFHAANVTRSLPRGDFLQFELRPNVHQQLFGKSFTTNAHGMRDREYTLDKPADTFRIALLGSSMDMGWGVGTDDTYVNLLEDWLNSRAARRGLTRRFEVLNFAVAAYSPLQRLESYRRKARRFDPDLVLFSATTLDTRLMEIHLCDLFRARADLPDDFLKQTVIDAGLTAEDLRTEHDDQLVYKETIKKKLRPFYWPIYDATLGALAAECRSADIPLACLIIPRVGKADTPDARAVAVARFRGIAAHHALSLFDLSDTFDGQDPADLEIAPLDDHPNALGHRHLFRKLSRALITDPGMGDLLFPPASTTSKSDHE